MSEFYIQVSSLGLCLLIGFILLYIYALFRSRLRTKWLESLDWSEVTFVKYFSNPEDFIKRRFEIEGNTFEVKEINGVVKGVLYCTDYSIGTCTIHQDTFYQMSRRF